MDLVNQNLHVLRQPGVRVDGLRLVAHDAEFHLQARPAVADQGVMALVAGVGGHHGARDRHGVAVGNEAVDVVAGLAPLIECSVRREVALGGNAD